MRDSAKTLWRGYRVPRWVAWSKGDRFLTVMALSVGFVLYRIWLATQSGFGFHQGWNEAHYALLASGFLEHPLVPRYGSNPIYNVPPLFPYVVAAFFAIFGESVLVARLPSILATGGTAIATYALGRVVYEDREVGWVGGALFLLLPMVQLYGGRAQTDMLMTFFFTSALACIVYGYGHGGGHWLVPGGVLFAAAVAAKQPALLLPVVVLTWLVLHNRMDAETVRDTGILVLASAIALVPLVTWYYLNFRTAPAALVADLEHEMFSRTPAFANVPLIVAIGLGLGVTPLVAGLVGYRGVVVYRNHPSVTSLRRAGNPNVIVVWLVVYGTFVLYRTPRGHQYYLLAVTPAIALLASSGLRTVRDVVSNERVTTLLVAFVVVSTVGGTVVLFELSGEYSLANGGGETVAPETSDWIKEELPAGATLLVVNEYRPPVQWYLRSSLPADHVRGYLAADFSADRLEQARTAASGPVFVVYPRPTWGTAPVGDSSLVYRSAPYGFTLMDPVGRIVQTDSKFVFYLEDRRLVVYRLVPADTDR